MISAIFLFSGINKIYNYDGTVGWMEGFGIPGFLLVPAIIIEILFPLMIIIGYKARIAAGGLLLFSSIRFYFSTFNSEGMIITAGTAASLTILLNLYKSSVRTLFNFL